jgi:hypothetical protein
MPFRLPDDIAHTIVDPRSDAAWDELHEKLKNVRRECPLARAEIDDYAPFRVTFAALTNKKMVVPGRT